MIVTLVREQIRAALEEVTTKNAPKVHKLIASEHGYKNIEERIIKMMIDEQMTASACIVHVERML